MFNASTNARAVVIRQLVGLCFIGMCCFKPAAGADFPLDAKRILFLGDSITHAGHYISLFELHSRFVGGGDAPEMINLGLPSETCTGLSEPDHPFPRPDVHERLERALSKLKPDVVFACYGMNDGIYYPLSDERFAAYQEGIGTLIKKVQATGAKLVLLTPPPFDPLPLRRKGKLLPAGADKYAWHSIYEGYDEVMDRYSKWLLEQKDRVEDVVDLRTPVMHYTEQKRKQNESFTMSPDGVHLNPEGHAVLADALLKHFDIEKQKKLQSTLLKLTEQRQKLLHEAWVQEVGHLRPGVAKGLPLQVATQQADAMQRQIRGRVKVQVSRDAGEDDRPSFVPRKLKSSKPERLGRTLASIHQPLAPTGTDQPSLAVISQ